VLAMKRIIIVGTTGCGKSVLAEKLSQKFALSVTDLDDLYWQPGWIPVSLDEFVHKVDKATSSPAWIISGNYSRLRDLVWERADTVIWLDYGFWLIMHQLLIRSVSRVINKTPVCNGNIETWKRLFSKDSILIWMLKSFTKKRREYGTLTNDRSNFAQISFFRLHSPADTEKFLESLGDTNPIGE